MQRLKVEEQSKRKTFFPERGIGRNLHCKILFYPIAFFGIFYSMNYRKYYEQQTKQKLPKGFDVHHLDFNRENNNISNLVALPKKTHNKYHFLLQQTGIDLSPITINDLIPSGIINKGCAFLYHRLQALNSFLEVYQEVQEWVLFRQHLIDNFYLPQDNKSYYGKNNN